MVCLVVDSGQKVIYVVRVIGSVRLNPNIVFDFRKSINVLTLEREKKSFELAIFAFTGRGQINSHLSHNVIEKKIPNDPRDGQS